MFDIGQMYEIAYDTLYKCIYMYMYNYKTAINTSSEQNNTNLTREQTKQGANTNFLLDISNLCTLALWHIGANII